VLWLQRALLWRKETNISDIVKSDDQVYTHSRYVDTIDKFGECCRILTRFSSRAVTEPDILCYGGRCTENHSMHQQSHYWVLQVGDLDAWTEIELELANKLHIRSLFSNHSQNTLSTYATAPLLLLTALLEPLYLLSACEQLSVRHRHRNTPHSRPDEAQPAQ
jgi:hypothetical protein